MYFVKYNIRSEEFLFCSLKNSICKFITIYYKITFLTSDFLTKFIYLWDGFSQRYKLLPWISLQKIYEILKSKRFWINWWKFTYKLSFFAPHYPFINKENSRGPASVSLNGTSFILSRPQSFLLFQARH